MKRVAAAALALITAFAFMPVLPGGQASAATAEKIGEYSFTGTAWGDDTVYASYTNKNTAVQYNIFNLSYDSTIYLKVKEPVDYSLYIFDSLEKLNSAASAGTMTNAGYVASYSQKSTGYEFELKAGTYYFASYRPTGLNGTSIKYDVYWTASERNTSMKAADSVSCDFSKTATASDPTIHDVNCGMDGCGSGGTLYWKFTVTDKAYYKLQGYDESYTYRPVDSTTKYYDMKILDSKGNVVKAYTSDPIKKEQQGYVALDKGTYYIASQAGAFAYSYGMILSCYDFREITSFSVANVSGYAGDKLTLKLTASPSDFESTFNVNGTKFGKGQTVTFQYARPGKYSFPVKTSEGLSKTVSITIKPVKLALGGARSQGTWKSTTLYWPSSTRSVSIGSKYYPNEPNANFYRVYMYKGGKYVRVWQGAAKSGVNQSATITGLAGNKTYSFKIAACWKCSDGTVIEGAQSDVLKAVTAPAKAPVIKKAKATGTKYHKATKTYHSGRWDAGGVWHSGYYTKNPAYSSAAVKVTYTKVKGATSYTSNGVSFKKNIAGYTIAGKVKAGKKVKVKVRTVKKSGSSIAYGPWSKAKTVKLKKAR